MKKLIILFLLGISLLSCKKQGNQVYVSKSLDNFEVSLLFEVDSIRVYRFYDCGRHVYFTSRPGKTSYNGKSTTVIETLNN